MKHNSKIFKNIIVGLSLAVMSIGIFGCKNFTTGAIDKGVIEYDISYPTPSEITMSLDLMPKSLVFKFDDNYTLSEISAGMGVFNTMVITDKKNKNITQRLSVMGKKYKVDFNSAQLDSLIAAEPAMTYTPTEETKTIAGYKCKKVICEIQDSTHKKLDIYYTNEIKLDQPNWYSIYGKIDGVLMEYYIKRYGINMKFTAKTVSAEGIDDDTFKSNSEYKTISNAEMEGYFKMY